MKNGEWRIICNTTDIQIAFYINSQFSINKKNTTLLSRVFYYYSVKMLISQMELHFHSKNLLTLKEHF